jgi:hypothetical protein
MENKISIFEKIRIAKAEGKRRMDICRGCPFFDSKLKRCRKCGCFMEAKTKIPGQKCPEGKWGPFRIK